MVFLELKQEQLSSLDDKELVTAILQTTERAMQRACQEELYNRYADKVYFKCLAMVKDPDKAKDIAHDVLVKMFLKLKEYKGTGPLYGWLFAITYNFCINFLKKEKRLRTESFDLREYDVGTDEIEEENQELHELQLTQLELLMDTLEDDERLILLMRYQDDLSVRQMAEALDIGESAVKMRLKRSRDRLAHLFRNLQS